MTLDTFLDEIKKKPDQISFDKTMSIIDDLYVYNPVSFRNGILENAVGENSGSCKLFAFAKLNGLTESQTLHCFGDYYRIDVLQSSESDCHMNIRNFMQTGWSGITFSNNPLDLKVYREINE